ncbi:MAG TPA: VOC family protein [Devosia sp.]|nr:VOC family protein [Devosia sp.]
MPANIVNWFDIPVSDMDRAVSFYAAVIGQSLSRYSLPNLEGATFPETGVSGTLLKGTGFVPSTDGAVVYLDGGDDLAPMLGRAEKAGATVILPKTEIPGGRGFFAYFLDTEGNRIGLHSRG